MHGTRPLQSFCVSQFLVNDSGTHRPNLLQIATKNIEEKYNPCMHGLIEWWWMATGLLAEMESTERRGKYYEDLYGTDNLNITFELEALVHWGGKSRKTGWDHVTWTWQGSGIRSWKMKYRLALSLPNPRACWEAFLVLSRVGPWKMFSRNYFHKITL